VFVGFPIWWGVEPRAVDTFLDGGNFAGKKMIPFATSGGSGIGDVARYLAPSAPGAALKPGKRLGGHEDRKALKIWTDGLGL
jgi:hypothetical protein